MDDERKKPAGKRGPPRGGRKFDRSRGGPASGREDKQRFSGKDGKPRFSEGGGKPDKPFRVKAKPAARQERDGDRPFRRPREDGSAEARAERPARHGPRSEDKPFKPRGEGKTFKPRGEGKPFKPRREASDQTSERPPRRFDSDDRRGEGKPFKPRGEGAGRPGRREREFSREGGDAADPARSERAPAENFVRKRREDAEHPGERPPSRFDNDHRRSDGDRPFKPRFGKPGGDERGRKPFEKHSKDGAKSFGEKRFGDRKRTFAHRPETADEAGGERIAKRLARVGIASRRDAEELIAAGRVRVNGKVLESPAFNVTVEDVIELDGKPLPPVERTRLFLFHKPAGVVTTSRDPEGRKTVFDVLPADLPRLITVGRLDINTEGLLLLTNDGGLARTLELPATGWLRRYRARVHGKVEEQALAGLKDGIAVDGVFYGAIEASLDREQGSNAWLTLGLREGKNREVKNILGALGLDVTRLIRVSFGPFQLGELPEGHVLEMKGRMLRDQLGERLIEESGANFEADVVKPFSNKPTRRHETAERPAPREARPLNIGEGGLIKKRARSRDDVRESALGKLSTRPDRRSHDGKPERGAKPGFAARPRGRKADEGERRPFEMPALRKANVWMAPGARPLATGKAAEKAAAAGKGRKPGKGGGKPFGKGPRVEGRGGKPFGGPPRSGKPRKGE